MVRSLRWGARLHRNPKFNRTSALGPKRAYARSLRGGFRMFVRRRISIARVIVLSSVAVVGGCSSGSGGSEGSAASEPAPTLSARAASALPGLEAPRWATQASYAGRVDPAAVVSIQVHLQMRDMDGARAELRAISDPKSARYGNFLSDVEFDAKYGPTQADADAVRAHLESHGLRVVHAPANRAFLTAQGTAANVERAFGTRLGTYRVTGAGGELRRAPLDAAALPADIAPRVAAVMGLSTSSKMHPMIVRAADPRSGARMPGGLRPIAAPADTPNPAPACGAYWDQSTDTTAPAFGDGYAPPYSLYFCNGYTPPQVRDIYALDAAVRAGADGRGQTIAIVDAFEAPTLLQDAQQYAANNDPDFPFAASQFTDYAAPGSGAPPPTPSDLQGWYGEQGLDVEAVHAIAPKAHIAYVAAASDDTTDLVAGINTVITDHLADIVSGSWGEQESGAPAGDIPSLEQVILQGSLKGIEFVFGSGDWGDGVQQSAISGVTAAPSAFFPSSLPYVTSAGGTSVALGKNNRIDVEVGWENGAAFLLPGEYEGSWLAYLQGVSPVPVADGGAAPTWWPSAPGGYDFGSGGGPSATFAQPWYQALAVPPSLSRVNGASWRVTPDVALLGDPDTGMQIGETTNGVYFEGASGGTSLATPQFAALVALAQQKAGRALGFVNPLVYATAPLGTVRDIRPARTGAAMYFDAYGLLLTLDYHGPENTLSAAVGYDDVTGLGTPNGPAFIDALGLLGKL
jgi:subtilase family serine protease